MKGRGGDEVEENEEENEEGDEHILGSVYVYFSVTQWQLTGW